MRVHHHVGSRDDGRVFGGKTCAPAEQDDIAASDIGVLAGANQLAVDATVARANTRPTTYGSILEDISHSVEGGLYAELVRNRSRQRLVTCGLGPVGRVRRRALGLFPDNGTPHSAHKPEAIAADTFERSLMTIGRADPASRFRDDINS